MMGQDDEMQVADRLRPLAKLNFPEEDALRAEEQRHRIVSRARRLVKGAGQARVRRMRFVAGGATAFAAAAALLLWLRPQGSEAVQAPAVAVAPLPLTLSVDGSDAEVAHAAGVAHIHAGQRSQLAGVKRVSTPGDSTASIEVADHSPQAGLKIVAGPDSEIAIERVSADSGLELLQLSRGQVDVKVPKLKEGSSFIIVTPSFRAYVVGTAFTLAVDPEAEQDSCLRVTEGLVRVEKVEAPHAELALVGAGQDWGCEAAVEKQARAAPVQQQAEQRRPQQAAPAKVESPAGTLAEETALLARAVRSNQQGHFAAAERDVMKLLAEYPQSPFAADARRLLKQARQAQED